MLNQAAQRAQALRKAEAGLGLDPRDKTPLRDDLGRARRIEIERMTAQGTLDGAIGAASDAVHQLRNDLYTWFADNGITTQVEAWVPQRDTIPSSSPKLQPTLLPPHSNT